MPGTNQFQQPPIPEKTALVNINGSLPYNKQKLMTNLANNHRQPQQQPHHHPHRNFPNNSVIKPLRSNQSLILPGMGIIGRSIKFEVISKIIRTLMTSGCINLVESKFLREYPLYDIDKERKVKISSQRNRLFSE